MRSLVYLVALFFSVTGAAMTDQARLQSHLQFVHELISERDQSHLTTNQKLERQKGLMALKSYYEAGIFPQNHDFPGVRIPYFIDEHGTPCAVALIMINSGYGKLAQKISNQNNHIYIDQMNDVEVTKWVSNSGFTLDELRLIQPSYAYTPRFKDILLELAFLGDEKGVREKLKKEEVVKVRLNLALQVTARTADAEYMKKEKPRNRMEIGIFYEPPPFVGKWAGVARALIEKGADPQAKNSKGQSALDLAKDPSVKAVLSGTSKLSFKIENMVEPKFM